MPKKINIITWSVAAACIILLFALLWIIYNLDPFTTSGVLVLFYLVVFFLISGASFLTGFSLRKLLGKREFLLKHFQVSLRQSIWLGFIAVFGLLLISFGIFNLINGFILVIMFAFLEAYFLYQPTN